MHKTHDREYPDFVLDDSFPQTVIVKNTNIGNVIKVQTNNKQKLIEEVINKQIEMPASKNTFSVTLSVENATRFMDLFGDRIGEGKSYKNRSHAFNDMLANS